MNTPTTPSTAATPYRYFVSFFIAPSGFGNTEIALRLPIRGMADVKVIADLISRNNHGDDVIVLHFTALPDAA